MNILPKGNARITRAGLKFKNLFYGLDKAIAEQWYLKYKNTSIEVVYDPRNMNQIYIPHTDGRNFDPCYLLPTSEQYKGDILEEIEFYQEMLQEQKALQVSEQHENAINTDVAIEQIVKKAIIDKKKVEQRDINKSEKLKNIRVNRQVEKQINREEEKFDLTTKHVSEPPHIIDFKTKEKLQEPTIKSSNARLMEKLRKKRDEEFEKE